jgi:sensor histidine kinase regulating citrate/malate metabolism
VSLRTRLTLFFVVIVMLPVVVATAYGWQTVARSSQRQVEAELEQGGRAARVE